MSKLLRVRDLAVTFPVHGGILRRRIGTIRAVRQASFSIRQGETLALVGESGSGKSTIARAIVRIVAASGGSVLFDGVSLLDAAGDALKGIRRNLQMVFQDPFSSLNRRMRVGDIVAEPLRVHGIGDAAERRDRVAELLADVGLGADAAARYPVAFSGGQRQRIAIARAIALRPKLVICDEAISALDVSIQAQILNLLLDLKRRHGLSYLFITHDLGVARRFADRVAVMHAGTIVETAPPAALFAAPQHPYTRALVSAVPRLPDGGPAPPRIRLSGLPPSPTSDPAGCLFAQRCRDAQERCRQVAPSLRPSGPARKVACHLVGDETSMIRQPADPTEES
jgi:oligopeptide transport system ATP-binding protein